MTSRSGYSKRSRKVQYDPVLVVAGAITVVALAILAIYFTREQSSSSSASPAGTMPNDFTLDGLEGAVSLADYRGQYVLVNFWATWCPPCRAEMPDLHAYYRAHQAQGFTLIAVNVMEDAATAGAFIRQNGFTFPVALDTTGSVFDDYGLESLPSSFLIGPDGTVKRQWLNMVDRATLEREITPLLGS